MSEKGKDPTHRAVGPARRTEKEQLLQPERRMEEADDDNEQVQESLRQKERKPNRP